MAVSITFTQDAFRGRNDDGPEATATWKAPINTNWVQPAETPFRIRFLVHRNNESSSQNGHMDLYVSKNSGAFELIDSAVSTCPVIPVLSATLEAQGTDTTQQLGTGTYLVNNNGINNGTSSAQTEAATWTNGILQEAEMEYCLKIVRANVQIGDTLEFRCRFSEVIFTGGYTNVPIITVAPSSLSIKGGTITIKGGTLTLK